MTLLLTALIWASADRLVNESVALQATILPQRANPSSGMLLQPVGSQDRIEITLSGPRRVVDLARSLGPLQVRVPVDEQPTGEAIVPIGTDDVRRELTGRSRDFDRLRVVNVEPREIHVLVDRMVSRDVELTIRNTALDYEVEPQLQRSSVRLRLRESMVSAIPDEDRLSFELGPEAERLLKEKPFGKGQTVSVRLDPQFYGPDAEFSPAAVEVTATVRAERVIQQIPTVPVLVAMSVGNLSKSIQAVARDGTPLTLVTQTISVTGSPDAVGRLARGETRVYGIIQLKEEDLETLGVVKLVTPEYHLPRDVELVSAPPPIELKLVAPADQTPE